MRPTYFIPVAFLAAGILSLYFFFDPGVQRFFPRCPFRLLTGLNCPGCGSQRAVHALLHGNFALAADHNLLLVGSLPFLLVHAIYKVRVAFGEAKPWRLIYHRYTPRVVVVVVICFWVLRNLPLYPFNYLAS